MITRKKLKEELKVKKELDKGLSAIVLIALAVIWILLFFFAEFANTNMAWILIAKDVILGLTYLVLLYNAWGWSRNFILRILFVVIVGFLIFCLVAKYIPALPLQDIPFPFISL